MLAFDGQEQLERIAVNVQQWNSTRHLLELIRETLNVDGVEVFFFLISNSKFTDLQSKLYKYNNDVVYLDRVFNYVLNTSDYDCSQLLDLAQAQRELDLGVFLNYFFIMIQKLLKVIAVAGIRNINDDNTPLDNLLNDIRSYDPTV